MNIFTFVYTIFCCVSIRLLKCGFVRQNTTLYFTVLYYFVYCSYMFRPSSGFLGDGVIILFTFYLYLHYTTTTISDERSLITFYVYFSYVGPSRSRGRLLSFFCLRSSILMFSLSVRFVVLFLMRGVCLVLLRVCSGRLLFCVCGSCIISDVY
jgi:hypothetical protein